MYRGDELRQLLADFSGNPLVFALAPSMPSRGYFADSDARMAANFATLPALLRRDG